MPTHIPTAPLANACTPRPTASPTCPSVDSPGSFCQLVLEVKEIAVLKASAGVMPLWPHGSGRYVCSSNSPYRNNTLTAEKASSEITYVGHRCWLPDRAPMSR
jgi:hypothetical protein